MCSTHRRAHNLRTGETVVSASRIEHPSQRYESKGDDDSIREGNSSQVRPRRPCNFSEEGDEYEMHDDYHEHQRNDEEVIAWQHHLSNCIDDQLMADVAQNAVEEANARARDNGSDVPEFIKVKKEMQRRSQQVV